MTQPLLGSLAEDIGLRTVAALGVLASASFLSLVGVAPELWILFALLVIGGLGSAALYPVGTTIAAASTRGNRAVGVGLFTAGGMIGFALGPVLILYLVSRHGTDATPWLMVPGVLLAAAVYLLLPDWQPHGSGSESRRSRPLDPHSSSVPVAAPRPPRLEELAGGH